MRFPRAGGVLLHPTSLPGPHGSGDLGATAYHFVDWLVAGGQQLWQILPLGGVGPGNSPYMSTSAFAGNVLLVDLGELHALGWLDDADIAPPGFDERRIDFPAVIAWRMERLERASRAVRVVFNEQDQAQVGLREGGRYPVHLRDPDGGFRIGPLFFQRQQDIATARGKITHPRRLLRTHGADESPAPV